MVVSEDDFKLVVRESLDELGLAYEVITHVRPPESVGVWCVSFRDPSRAVEDQLSQVCIDVTSAPTLESLKARLKAKLRE